MSTVVCLVQIYFLVAMVYRASAQSVGSKISITSICAQVSICGETMEQWKSIISRPVFPFNRGYYSLLGYMARSE